MGEIRDILRRFHEIEIQDLDDVGMKAIVLILAISFAASTVLFVSYQLWFERRSTGTDIHRSFLLIGPAVTAIFLCLQFSLPLSLGLLGALSIVRFRTPIKEPEEIGFLMVLIASSLCCATLNIRFLGALLGTMLLGLLFLQFVGRWAKRERNRSSLVVDLPDDAASTLEEMLGSLQNGNRGFQLQSVETAGGRTRFCLWLDGDDERALLDAQRSITESLPEAEVRFYLPAAH